MTRVEIQSAGRSAFTLVELMVVLVLIAILSAVILPEMRGTFEDALLKSTSRQLMNAFSIAYSRAVTTGVSHRLRLDSRGGRFQLEEKGAGVGRTAGYLPVTDVQGSTGKLDSRISVALRKGDATGTSDIREKTGMPSAQANLDRDSAETITFNPDGTTEACAIELKDRAGFRLGLEINPITARVRLVDLDRK
jgi:type II secretion system protein H